MKNSLLSVIAFLLIINSAYAQNDGDIVFAGLQVHTINIQLSQPNYWDSLVYYYNQGNEQYMVAAVTINGVLIDSVGVRLKGNSSYSHPNNKKPFRLSFDEYREDQRWDGLKGIHLNNCWGDPTFIREKLHLDFCRDAGVKAPRANYANLYLNGQLWGFYSLVEHVDKRFLSSRYGNTDGNLFKAVDGFGSPLISDFRWYGSAASNYFNRYELKTEESTTAWPDLVRTLDTLNNSPNTLTALPTQVNLSSVYKAFAVDNIFANLDSYIGGGRNFYFYYCTPDHKMEWIVWDVSLSIGGYSGGVSNYETMSLTYVSSSTNRPLFNKILNTPALRSEYLRTLCLIYYGYFSSARLFPKIDSIANVIRLFVYADPRKMYTNAQFETNIVSDVTASGGGSNRKPGLKSFITARQTSIQTQLTNLGVSCALAALPGDVVINEFMALNTTIPDPAGQYDDWIELYNNTSDPINLGGMYLSDDPALPTKWQFPDNTIINGNSFLIVWADNDTGQAGLHANFALSGDGEQIILSNIDVSVLDTITFGPQVPNLSMSRIPNGTGQFVQGLPTFNAPNSTSGTPAITSILVPQYIQGLNGTNNTRVPYVFRVRFDNLQPNATYRFINQVVLSTDGATTNGAGNCIFVNPSGSFTRTTGPSFTTAGDYGEFTTDASGSYTGWFITEPSGNARFTPGNHIFMRIRLNDGAGGTTAATYLTTSDSIKVINFGNSVDPLQGTGIFGYSNADPKDFVFLFDNVDGNNRPIASAIVEKDGLTLSTNTSFVLFYRDSVDGFDGAWGSIIPNDLPNGIRRIERRLIADGTIHPVLAVDPDGIWPSGSITVNPTGGLTPIKIEISDAPLPVELVSFTATVNGSEVVLNWITASEFNNRGFDVERASSSNSHLSGGTSPLQGWEKIGFLSGAGTSTTINTYSFTNKNLPAGTYNYRLKQIDLNGTFTYSKTIEVTVDIPVTYSLEQNYPNPFNPSTIISFSIPELSHVTLKIYNMLGVEIATIVDETKGAGKHKVEFNGSNLGSGVYFYTMKAGNYTQTRKMMIIK